MKRLLGFITSLVLLLTAVFPAYAAENGHVIINQVYGASNDGKVVQHGTHAELATIPGKYKKFIDIRRKSEGWNIAE